MVEKHADIMTLALRAEDELRRQSGLVVRGDTDFAFIPIESLSAENFKNLQTLHKVSFRVVIAAQRAKSILASGGADPVDIDASALSFAQLQCLADPLAEKTALPKPSTKPASVHYRDVLILTKYASLLPALLVIEGDVGQNYFRDWQSVEAKTLRDYIDAPHTDIIETARAKLPIKGAENSSLVSFRERRGASVHLALIVGEKLGDSPLTRIHSSCVTGDILGSLRCDCGGQLQLALSQIIAEGSGLLIYLHQEGRGIGITNKLRAYALQEQGFDTYEANLMLGFEEDERDFSIAAGILKNLGVKNIRLLTNNPYKISSLEKQGIIIAQRVPLIAKGGEHSHAYIDAKTKKSGHLF